MKSSTAGTELPWVMTRASSAASWKQTFETGVVEHRRSHGRVELVEVLVGEHQPDPQASGLTEGIGQIGAEMEVVGELVEVDEHRVTTTLGDGGPTEGRLPELGQDQRPERARRPRDRAVPWRG